MWDPGRTPTADSEPPMILWTWTNVPARNIGAPARVRHIENVMEAGATPGHSQSKSGEGASAERGVKRCVGTVRRLDTYRRFGWTVGQWLQRTAVRAQHAGGNAQSDKRIALWRPPHALCPLRSALRHTERRRPNPPSAETAKRVRTNVEYGMSNDEREGRLRPPSTFIIQVPSGCSIFDIA